MHSFDMNMSSGWSDLTHFVETVVTLVVFWFLDILKVFVSSMQCESTVSIRKEM